MKSSRTQLLVHKGLSCDHDCMYRTRLLTAVAQVKLFSIKNSFRLDSWAL